MYSFSVYLAQQLIEPAPTQNPSTGGNTSSSGGQFSFFLMLGALVVSMYFLLIRPQRKEEKRKKEMLKALDKGDPVTTGSGILGTVSSVKENSVIVNVGNDVRIEFLRSAISQVRKNKSQKE